MTGNYGKCEAKEQIMRLPATF